MADRKNLKYVLIQETELIEKGRYLLGIKELLADMAVHGVKAVSPIEGWKKPEDECILLSSTDLLLQKAKERNMAAIAFENDDYPEEKQTNSPVLLQGFEEIDYNYIERMWQRKQGIPQRILETDRCYLRAPISRACMDSMDMEYDW